MLRGGVRGGRAARGARQHGAVPAAGGALRGVPGGDARVRGQVVRGAPAAPAPAASGPRPERVLLPAPQGRAARLRARRGSFLFIYILALFILAELVTFF